MDLATTEVTGGGGRENENGGEAGTGRGRVVLYSIRPGIGRGTKDTICFFIFVFIPPKQDLRFCN